MLKSCLFVCLAIFSSTSAWAGDIQIMVPNCRVSDGAEEASKNKYMNPDGIPFPAMQEAAKNWTAELKAHLDRELRLSGSEEAKHFVIQEEIPNDGEYLSRMKTIFSDSIGKMTIVLDCSLQYFGGTAGIIFYHFRDQRGVAGVQSLKIGPVVLTTLDSGVEEAAGGISVEQINNPANKSLPSIWQSGFPGVRGRRQVFNSARFNMQIVTAIALAYGNRESKLAAIPRLESILKNHNLSATAESFLRPIYGSVKEAVGQDGLTDLKAFQHSELGKWNQENIEAILIALLARVQRAGGNIHSPEFAEAKALFEKESEILFLKEKLKAAFTYLERNSI